METRDEVDFHGKRRYGIWDGIIDRTDGTFGDWGNDLGGTNS